MAFRRGEAPSLCRRCEVAWLDVPDHRLDGSSAFPSRVFQGNADVGHMGDARITTRNLRILGVDKEENLLVVEGSVPGANGGYIQINKAKKPPESAADLRVQRRSIR